MPVSNSISVNDLPVQYSVHISNIYGTKHSNTVCSAYVTTDGIFMQLQYSNALDIHRKHTGSYLSVEMKATSVDDV